jgi:RNA polymerase sigma factor (sigma-70 family)
MAGPPTPLLRHIRRLVDAPPADAAADAALLERFVRERNDSAFAALVARHGPMVLRLLGDVQDAEDVFQATFLVLARKAAAVRRPERLAGWLYGVAYRLALKARTARARQRARETRAVGTAAGRLPGDPLDELTAREVLLILEEEVQRLPEVYRLPVLLCCLEGHTQDEAARLLGWTVGSLQGRLERGRARLQKRLVRRGVSLAVALAAADLARGRAAAGVPAGLAETTVRAGLQFVRGGDAAAAASAEVTALARGGLRSLSSGPTRLGIVLVLAAGMVVAGAGLAARQVPAAGQDEAPQAAAPRPPEQADGERRHGARRTDRYGDPLPAGAITRLGTERLHGGSATGTVAFSPDGKALVSACFRRGLCVWDPATGKVLREIERVENSRALAVSPDGRLLAGARVADAIDLWDLRTGRRVQELPADLPGTMAVAFSPDGRLLARAGWGVIDLYDLAGGAKVRRLRGNDDVVWTVAFSPDGRTLASCSLDTTVRLWDPATGQEKARLSRHKNPVHGLAFFPDGKMLASAAGGEAVRLWDVASGRELRTLEPPEVSGEGLAVAPDGRLLATGHRDGQVRLWDPATGRELRRRRAHAFTVSALTFSPDGKTLVSGSRSDSSIRLWDPATGQERLPFGGPRATIWPLRFTADGKSVVFNSLDATVRRWDWAADRETTLATWPDNRLEWSASAESPDGRVRAYFADPGVYLWDGPAAREPRLLGKVPGGVIVRLAFSPDGALLAAGGQEGEIYLWEVATGRERLRLKAGHAIGALTFAPDGKALASGARPFLGNGGLPPGPTVRLWDVRTGQERFALPAAEAVDGLVFSPDGKRLLTTVSFHDRRPHLWDLVGRKELPLPAATAGCQVFAFSPDSRLLGLGSHGPDNRIGVVEVLTGREVLAFRGHHGGIDGLAFSRDDRLLVSTGGDATALLWDLTGHAPDGQAPSLRLSPRDLERCWADLANADAATAFRAGQALALAPPGQVVPLLHDRLRPEVTADAKQVAAWIRDLDSPEFTVREKAQRQLERIAGHAEPALLTALADRPSAEVRRRVEKLLGRLEPSGSGEQARRLRAIAVLEHFGTPGAVAELEHQAEAGAGSMVRREANAALGRLRPRATP